MDVIMDAVNCRVLTVYIIYFLTSLITDRIVCRGIYKTPLFSFEKVDWALCTLAPCVVIVLQLLFKASLFTG